nr:MAG TPA: hypothetical protein [Caudoviricetes sp.]
MRLSITGGINTLLNRGAVKSVQRGNVQGTGTSSTPIDVTINISEVNPDKCIVIVNASETYGGDTYVPGISVKGLEGASLALHVSLSRGQLRFLNFSWQVIEFY